MKHYLIDFENFSKVNDKICYGIGAIQSVKPDGLAGIEVYSSSESFKKLVSKVRNAYDFSVKNSQADDVFYYMGVCFKIDNSVEGTLFKFVPEYNS